ncbi:MAG: tetratricopeptide repeat protein [Pirellulales bacterium]
MKRLNLKFLALLVVCTGALVVAVAMVHYVQMRRNVGNMITWAEMSKKEGDLHEAAKWYARYVRQEPDDVEVWATLANLLADIADAPDATITDRTQAFNALEQTVRKDPERDAIRRRLVDYTIKIGRPQDAVDHLNILQKKFPKDAKLEVLLGRCVAAGGRYQDAVAHYQKAIKLAPGEIDAYTALASVRRLRLDQAKEADQAIEQMVKANPKSFTAYLERGHYRQQFESFDAAKPDYLQAQKLAPDDVEVILSIAGVSIQEANYAAATKEVERALKLHPKEVRLHRLYATLARADKSRPKAIARLQEGLKAVPGAPALLWDLAELQLDAGELKNARETIKRLVVAGYAPEPLEYLNSRILAADNKWAEAYQTLRRVQPLLAQSPELSKKVNQLLAQCLKRMGRIEEVVPLLGKIDITTVNDQLEYASALYAAGKLPEALAEYRKLTAGTYYDTLVATAGFRKPFLQLMLTENLSRPKDKRVWTEIDALLEKAAQLKVDPADLAIEKTDVLINKGEPQKAQELLAAALAADPKNVRIWVASAKLGAMQKDTAQGLKILDEAKAKLGDQVDLRLTKADLLARMGGDAAKKALAEVGRDVEKLPEADRLKIYDRLGAAYFGLREYSQAIAYYKLIAQRNAKDPRVWLRLFDVAREADDLAAMQNALDKLKATADTGSSLWQYAEASRLAWQVQKKQQDKAVLGQALKLLDRAAVDRPNWEAISRLRGEIYEMQGDVNRAITSYQKAMSGGAFNPAVAQRLVLLLYSTKRWAEAQQVLAMAAPLQDSAFMKRLSAEVALNTNQLERAVALASESVPDDSENPQDLLWYGQILARAGQGAKAEKMFRRAVEKGPAIPEAWLALVSYLINGDKLEEAQAVVREAKVKLPEDRSALILAQCYEWLHDVPQAEQYYLQAKEAKPDDVSLTRTVAAFYLRTNRAPQAKPYLEQIMKSPASEQNREALTWARRVLARQMTSTGDYREYLKALALLDKNAVGGKLAPEDIQVKATMLASRPELAPRREAVQLFEGFQRQRSLSPQEQFVLAVLYEREGQWPKATEQMLKLLSQNSDASTAGYLLAYLDMLLRHDEAVQASPYFEKLEKLDPKAPTTIAVKARLLAAQGQPDEAVKVVKAAIPSPLPDEQIPLLRSYAGVLEDLKQDAAAEDMFREFVARDPKSSLVLAEFLGRRKKLDEALKLCEKALQDGLSAEEVTQTAVSVLRSGDESAKPEHYRQVEGWIQDALKKTPDSLALRVQLAELRDVQLRSDDVEKLYREVLASPKLDDRLKAIVANNLAFQLATTDTDSAKLKEALQLIDTATSILGPASTLIDTRGMVRLANGQTPEAIADFKDAIADGPSGMKYFHLALGQVVAGNKPAAVTALAQAKKQPDFKATEVVAPLKKRYGKFLGELNLK